MNRRAEDRRIRKLLVANQLRSACTMSPGKYI
jgi:hypothetical protein